MDGIQEPDPKAQAAPALLRRLVEQAFNAGDLAILDELVAANSISHLERWGLPSGRAGLKLFIAALRSAFPDLTCAVEDEIQEGERFVLRCVLRGTHQGFFLGSPPTGRAVEAQGLILARVTGGWIVENWLLIDQLELLQQLGIAPPPRSIQG